MTTPSFTINPAVQTNFAGTFFATSDGYTQGDALDDPALRTLLRNGIVSPAATIPMWGGLLIAEALTTNLNPTVGQSTPPPAAEFRSILLPATSLSAGNAGFYAGVTVMNQATAMIQSAQSRAPQAPSSSTISFYRVGSGARIPLQCSSAAAAAWAGGTTSPQTIYWDTTALQLVNASSGSTIGPITNITLESISLGNSRVVTYNGTTGFTNWTETGYAAVVKI